MNASPIARRLAEEHGIDLSLLQGTGTEGRITQGDVEKAIREGTARKEDGVSGAPQAEYEELLLTGMRKIIASRLVQSKGPIPHFYLTIDIGMDKAAAMREEIKRDYPEHRVSFNDLVLKIIADTLVRHPSVNARLEGETIRRYHRVHLGFAVALEEGLLTPVIRECDTKNLIAVAREVAELSERARNRRLRRYEYEGGTCTVSNLGMFGIEEFSAVINPPEGAILAVGAIQKRPVVIDDSVEIQRRMKVTISSDHRVMDGAQAAQFLKDLKANFENPVVQII